MIEDWKGKHVIVLGLARQGKSLARYLTQQGAEVTVSDRKIAAQLGAEREELAGIPVRYVLGGHPPSMVDSAQALFLSGGVPADLEIVERARQRGVTVLNDAQLFLERSPAPVIGVTGSAGKTTTTTLTAEMAKRAFEGTSRTAWLGGNIGNPLLNDLGRMKADDLVVIELSSFQLEVMTVSPPIAALLNLTPDHLDRHHTMEAYVEAKARILSMQRPKDLAVLGIESERAWALRERVQGRLLAFGRDLPAHLEGATLERGKIVLRMDEKQRRICPADSVALRGAHNLLNVLAACTLAGAAGIPPEAMAEVAEHFQGVPHRLEFVRKARGASWFNDSIATTPDRALAGVRAFDEPLVLLSGGRDKDLDWTQFAREVAGRVEHIILFGEAAGKIQRAVEDAREGSDRPSVQVVPDLEKAVEAAAQVVQPGMVVLMSPGGTSFDAFANYEARGRRFRELVSEL